MMVMGKMIITWYINIKRTWLMKFVFMGLKISVTNNTEANWKQGCKQQI